MRKYDADGDELWTRQFGSDGTDFGRGLVVDATGIYVGGWTHGALPEQEANGR